MCVVYSEVQLRVRELLLLMLCVAALVIGIPLESPGMLTCDLSVLSLSSLVVLFLSLTGSLSHCVG